MRSADASRRLAAFTGTLLLAALGGCTSMPFSWDAVRGDAPAPAPAPAAAPAAKPAPAPAPAPKAVTPPPEPPPPPPPAPAPAEPPPPTLAERAAAILRSEAEVPAAAQRAFDAAREALRAGRVDEAERSFRALAKEHPELGGPQANLGLIYRQSGKLAESAAALEAAVKASPKQASYANQLGITYRQQGEFTKAREAYESALDIDPDYAPAVLNLGILNDLYLWDGKRALELYERYVALKPGGDAVVSKWITDLKNRKPRPINVSRKEQP
jgi:tetratricopeptide (TPR) repeat protein